MGTQCLCVVGILSVARSRICADKHSDCLSVVLISSHNMNSSQTPHHIPVASSPFFSLPSSIPLYFIPYALYLRKSPGCILFHLLAAGCCGRGEVIFPGNFR